MLVNLMQSSLPFKTPSCNKTGDMSPVKIVGIYEFIGKQNKQKSQLKNTVSSQWLWKSKQEETLAFSGQHVAVVAVISKKTVICKDKVDIRQSWDRKVWPLHRVSVLWEPAKDTLALRRQHFLLFLCGIWLGRFSLDLAFLICKISLVIVTTANIEYFLSARYPSKPSRYSY